MVSFSGSSLFDGKSGPVRVPQDCHVVFVSDMFVEDYGGGAELTSEALIQRSPFNVFKLHSTDVKLETLESGVDKHWIFGNFSNVDASMIPTIVSNLSYSILEYDYKYCKYRSPEKHSNIEQKPCDCHNQMNGKMISAFYYGAKSLWWMSERQQDRYHQFFPFLSEVSNVVLSSVFDENTFATLKTLRSKYENTERSGWVVLGSSSWIKGTEDAKSWCEESGKDYEVIWNLPYPEALEKLASSEGFVYLPKGGDTCPRMVIEAKLLGCELHINDNVEHANEIWFQTDNLYDTECYLYAARDRFWQAVKEDMSYNPTVSGYTTTLNCIDHRYPFEESILSMIGFCDEVVVVDAGSTDGTWEKLVELKESHENLVIHKEKRDLDHPRWSLSVDGLLKAQARSLCTSHFCWQQDVDEVVDESDYKKIRNITRNFPKQLELLALPVVEYWGGPEKVRIDVNPWKWRLSRNLPHITHGPPAQLRKYDNNGDLYCARGTDSCDYIRLDNYEPIPFATFYTDEAHNVRMKAWNSNLNDDSDLEILSYYESWFNRVISELPSVFHFSWWNIERKVTSYRSYWTGFWESMYNEKYDDIAENNVMFDCPWTEVTDDMVKERSQEFSDKLGGWIWHQKWNGEVTTPHMKISREVPKTMKKWIDSESSKSFK